MQTSRARLRAAISSIVFLSVLAPALAFGAAEEGSVWTPPKSEKWDWIHLNSGEWLKGEIKFMRDRKIKFDSDELDDLDVDLSDCRTVYIQRLSFIRIESGETAQGTGKLEGDSLTFQTVEGETMTIARSDLVAIVPGGDQELDYWSFMAGADYAMKDGNTDQVDLSGRLGLYRRSATLRFLNDYRGIYASQDGEKSTNNHRATSRLDIFLTSRLYLIAPSLEYYKDEFKNLKHRVTPGAGVGYEFIRNSYVELDVSTGAGYQFQESEDGATSDDLAGTLGIDLDFDLPGGTELDNSYALQYVVTDFNKTSHHFESVLSVDIWGPLDLNLTFMLDRIERPETDSNGDRPDSDDISVMAGFSIDF